jgi:hypothetical protein
MEGPIPGRHHMFELTLIISAVLTLPFAWEGFARWSMGLGGGRS